jgi:hypothetical protein
MLIEHSLRVRLCGCGQGRIPLKRLQTIFGAGLVGEIEKLLLLLSWNLLGVGKQAENQWKQQ